MGLGIQISKGIKTPTAEVFGKPSNTQNKVS